MGKAVKTVKTYTIKDLQNDETHMQLSEDDVLYFANDIFWNDPDVEFTDIDKAIVAIENSDYEVTEVPEVIKEKPIRKKKIFELER
ncbi:hypothetical protein NSQ59_27790 [Margalitia sp. FSL K6-0131]|uniref:hypothetical protein n=1 Tax=Margalitia sp. FSL K6-0131 TaxID=2954604 RepID=UPI0030F7E83E